VSGFIDPVAKSLYTQDHQASAETRTKLQQWEYLVYQADDDAALNAKNMLLDAIEAQHAGARALVAQVMPARKRPGLRRPLSKDEIDGTKA